MKFQIYMQFFPVENDSFNRQPRALAETIARAGHQVTVISDDSWLKEGDPRNEHHICGTGSWDVYRVASLKNMKASKIRRLRTYCKYAWFSYQYGKKLERPDCIVASIPPFFNGFGALALAKKHKIPLMLEVRDLWPDDLVARKLISKFAAMPMYPMVDSIYQGATRIFSLTPGIKTEIIKHGISAEKIDVIPVGCDKDLFAGLGPETRMEIREKYGWGNDFVAVYPGTHTEATALDVVVKAVNELKDLANFRVAFFGKGQTKEPLKKMAAEMGLTNIEFHDPVGKQEVAKILLAADMGLLNLQKSPISHIFFENKFMDYMVAKLPIFGSMDGQQADIIKKYDFGRIVPTDDFHGLSVEIRKAVAGEYDMKAMGERAYEYGMKRLDMDDMINKMTERIIALGEGKREFTVFEPDL